MASSSFDQDSFGTGMTNLSALAEGALTGGGSSQSGGNTISAKAGPLQTPLPGTPSEQTGTNVLGNDLDYVSHVGDPTVTGSKFTPSNRVETHNDGEVFGL